MSLTSLPRPIDLLAQAERARLDASARLDPGQRSALGQFFTPTSTARLMASMFGTAPSEVRLLDPGAGVGVLTAAWVADMLQRPTRPKRVALCAFEVDSSLIPALRRTLGQCEAACLDTGIEVKIELRAEDFIAAGVEALDQDLFGGSRLGFTTAILNPPYRKFRTESRPRALLRRIGMETSNLYTAFLALTVSLLGERGEFVSITPRSFCNGPYFRSFREHLLHVASLRSLHVFASRSHAFRDDDVLQENVIVHGVKGVPQDATVTVSESATPDEPISAQHAVPFARVVRPDDPQRFIHLVPDKDGHALAEVMEQLPCSLAHLGITVSTGRVVDFRARQWLRQEAETDTVPLIYPGHFSQGRIAWPKAGSKKPNAIAAEAASASLLIPAGTYVLVRRFSAKEEARRVVAAVFDPADVPCIEVGFENHLNYFHEKGGPLDPTVARGLAAFLNSSALDTYFRQFNGHTQVNATDLRMLRYPARRTLTILGAHPSWPFDSQEAIDAAVERALVAEVAR